MAFIPSDKNVLKLYMRIDGDEDDQMVTLAANAAQSYLIEAGIPAPVLTEGKTLSTDFPLYFLALCALALNWYDHRDAISDGSMSITPLGATSIIKSLQVSNLDTTGVVV